MVNHHPTDQPRGFWTCEDGSPAGGRRPGPDAVDGLPCHGRPGPVVFPTNIERVAGPPPHEPECALGGLW